MLVGQQYGLRPSDLWRATRQINLPELMDEKSTDCNLLRKRCLILGKFLELWSIWTASKSLAAGVNKSLSRRIWRTRQIGILFAKVNDSWVFLVLIAPLSVTYDYEVSKDEFNLWYRDPKAMKLAPYAWVASDAPIGEIIDILIDIHWGWKRYLAQVRNDNRGV